MSGLKGGSVDALVVYATHVGKHGMINNYISSHLNGISAGGKCNFMSFLQFKLLY